MWKRQASVTRQASVHGDVVSNAFCSITADTSHILNQRMISVQSMFVFRPHRSTTYVDAAYCYRSSSVVCRSVCPCVYHSSEPRKNGCTDRNAVPVVGWDGP